VVEDGYCVLADSGRAILRNSKPEHLFSIFAAQFIGITELVELLAESQPRNWDDLFLAWHTRVGMASQQASKWSTNHAKMQFRHRLDWLRSLGIVSKLADGYYLSKTGMEQSVKTRMSAATQKEEAESISHNDLEDKLKAIGEFFEFLSVKRATVNEARPSQVPKLTENRQLDCLWARVIHFGGKVQYAFEVQVGGSISDAIERLEMVAAFVQKAVIITDEDQQKKIQERLHVKQSLLRDKVLFLTYDDINSVVEAVNALKVFTQKLFHE
jgi:hypothetical protein